jgi:hypothetical protein
MLISGTCFSQATETLITKIYEVVNASFPGMPGIAKTKLLDVPLVMSRLNDSLLQNLVAQHKISAEETSYILQQTGQSPIKKWDRSLLHDIKTVKFSENRRYYPHGTYGISIPAFSKNGNLAIVYLQHVGSDSVHAAILVYERVNGTWKFVKSLLSEIS